MSVGRWQRRFAGQSFVLLVVLLPALVAGLGIAGAPGIDEWGALARAVDGHPANLVANAFLRLTVPTVAAVPAADSPAAAELLVTARLGQLLGLLLLAALAYLTIALTGSRARALLTVGFLAALPPVAIEGHVLRAETGAAALGLLTLLLLQLLALTQRPAALRHSRVTEAGLACTAAVAVGLSAAAAPTAGIHLLLPGGAAIAAAAQIGLRLVRWLRRRSLVNVPPLRAGVCRLWPWVFCSVAAVAAAFAVLARAVDAPEAREPTRAACGLLPAMAWLRYPLIALAVLGAVRLLLRTGQRFGRSGRLGPDLLLFLLCAVLLLQRFARDPAEDAIAAAVPMALLLADGAVYATLLFAKRR